MLRLDDDFFWQSFDKDYFQFTAAANCPPAPTTGADTFDRKIPIRLNPGQCRLTRLNKWTSKADPHTRTESPLLLACKAKIFHGKELGWEEPDPQKPNSL
jgi:hypothetical protein